MEVSLPGALRSASSTGSLAAAGHKRAPSAPADRALFATPPASARGVGSGKVKDEEGVAASDSLLCNGEPLFARTASSMQAAPGSVDTKPLPAAGTNELGSGTGVASAHATAVSASTVSAHDVVTAGGSKLPSRRDLRRTSSKASTASNNHATDRPASAGAHHPTAVEAAGALSMREQSYIPYARAREMVEKMENAMRAMKQKHLLVMDDMSGMYRQMESDSRTQFLQFINTMREKAREQLHAYKAAQRRAEAELRQVRDTSSQHIASLEAKVAQLEADVAAAMKGRREDVDGMMEQHSTLLTAMTEQHAQEVADLKARSRDKAAQLKARIVELEEQRNSQVGRRETVIGALEADRRRLVSAVNELHAARDALASSLVQMEQADATARSAAIASANDLVAQLNVQFEKNAGLSQDVARLSSQLAGLQADFDVAQQNLLLARADADATRRDMDALKQQVAMQKQALNAATSLARSTLSASAGDLHAGTAPAVAVAGEEHVLSSTAYVSLKTERDSMAQSIAALSSLNVALQQEIDTLRARAAETDVLHRIELLQARSSVPSAPAPASVPALASAPMPAAVSTRGRRLSVRLGAEGDDVAEEVRLQSATPSHAAGAAKKLTADELHALVEHATRVVEEGEAMWAEKKKRPALKLYLQECSALTARLPDDLSMHKPIADAFETACSHLDEDQPARAAFELKQVLDQFIAEGPEEVARLRATAPAAPSAAPQPAPAPTSTPTPAPAASTPKASAEMAVLQAELERTRANLAAVQVGTQPSASHAPSPAVPPMAVSVSLATAVGSGASTEALQGAVRRAETAEARVRVLEAQVVTLQKQVAELQAAPKVGAQPVSAARTVADTRITAEEESEQEEGEEEESEEEESEEEESEEEEEESEEEEEESEVEVADSTLEEESKSARQPPIPGRPTSATGGAAVAASAGRLAPSRIATPPGKPGARPTPGKPAPAAAAAAAAASRGAVVSPAKGAVRPGAPAGAASSAPTGAAAAASTVVAPAPAAGAVRESAKLKEQEKVIRELREKVRKLEAEAKAAPTKMAAAAVPDEKAITAAVEKRQAMLEKKWKKDKEDMEKDFARELDALTRKLTKAINDFTDAQTVMNTLTQERDALKKRVGGMGDMEKELQDLRVIAEESKQTQKALVTANARVEELDKLYRDEMILRKRYYNIIEDMKGKIRVYCRARPMSTSELERGNHSVVTFPDEVTIDLDTGKGHKQFVYDQCFGANSTQEQVFEDTEMLIQSAFDGYNVAIFAYGQTGSGKTWTMVGNRDMPGVTPRAVHRLYHLIEENKSVYDVQVQAYMVELYFDNLIDLFYKVDNPRERGEPPKLDIKKDDKGLVVIKGVTIKDCPTADSVLELFDAGNNVRHVGSTAMNATSSRSHLVFALLINTHNRSTKKTGTGKISLIDLAGSERAGKTGATAERLKEAQSINKSLSALGNVISALSTNAAFVPYRDNKLTQLMSDSLGGNAKTLMFVNLSPADYNAEETLSSLVYASRVKLITNNAEKMQESQEIARLKKIIATLKAGGTADVVLEEEAPETPASAAAGAGGADDDSKYDDGPLLADDASTA